MSKITCPRTCREMQVDENGKFFMEYEKDLPHSGFIADYVCDKWNEDAEKFMLDFMNMEFENKIASCRMRRCRPGKGHAGETVVAVDVVFKPGVRVNAEMKWRIADFMSRRFCDGWGADVFGPWNAITAPDGTRLYID